ncbi:MAG TPA: TIGR03790 family protein [Chthoniobacteraceae bacterium]|nr:TIGR03790 family protein [Chthoniobacteraceae bacterium]
MALAALLAILSGLRAYAASLTHSASEVLLVYNSNSPVSTAIANYYASRRGITNILPIACIDSATNTINENIPMSLFTSEIADPVSNYLSTHNGINFIVLTKGVPIRICATDLGYINPGCYSGYDGIPLTSATSFSARVANPGSKSTVQVTIDSPTGTVIATGTAPKTGGFQKWTTITAPFAGGVSVSGTHTIYLNYNGSYNVEWFSFSNSANQYQATNFSESYGGVQGEQTEEGGSTTTGSQPDTQKVINYNPSVDSYLSVIDYPTITSATTATLNGSGAVGVAWVNRYYFADVPFSHAAFGGYLVTRLDGYTEAEAMGLVDKAMAAETSAPSGPILLDCEPGIGTSALKNSGAIVADKTDVPIPVPLTVITSETNQATYNSDMLRLGDILKVSGIPCDVDLTGTFDGNQTNLLGYFSYGSNDGAFVQQSYNSIYFAPGAIADTNVSTSGRSFLPLNDGGQSMIADLIAQGATGATGYVDEPLLDGISSPYLDMTHYLSGYTLAESFYSALKYLGWESVIIGDPLCCPYPAGKPLPAPTLAFECSGSSGSLSAEGCSESSYDLGFISNGNYTWYNNINLTGKTNMAFRLASDNTGGGAVQVRLDGPQGTIIGTCTEPFTGDWEQWTTVNCPITPTVGTHNLYLVSSVANANFEWWALESGTNATEAASANSLSSGLSCENCTEGGLDITNITAGSDARYSSINLTGATCFSARVASATASGNIQIWLDSPSGTLVGSCAVPATGGSQIWTSAACGLSGASGYHDVYLVFTGSGGNLFNLESFGFSGVAGTTQASGDTAISAGVTTETCSEGGLDITGITDGAYAAYGNLNMNGVTQLIARVASSGSGGTLAVRMDCPTGTLLGTLTVPSTGGSQTWSTEACTLSGASGYHTIYLVAIGGGGSLFNLEWFAFPTDPAKGRLAPGSTVELQAVGNGAYVSASNSGAVLAASATSAGTAEQFQAVDAGGGNIALLSLANDRYVEAASSSSNTLIADHISIGSSETFTEDDFGGNNLALLSQSASLYASATYDGLGPLIADAIYPSPSEVYTANIIPPSPPVISGPSMVTGTSGSGFSLQITANNWATTYNAYGLPPGLSINGSGLITGTASVTGTFAATIYVSNAGGTASSVVALDMLPSYTGWQNIWFNPVELANSSISGTSADPAGDGMPNLLKYALNVDPWLCGVLSLPFVSIINFSGSNYAALTYTQLVYPTDITYVPQVSNDLETWNSGASYIMAVSATPNPDGTTETVTVRDNTPLIPGSSQFMRLKVTSP